MNLSEVQDNIGTTPIYRGVTYHSPYSGKSSNTSHSFCFGALILTEQLTEKTPVETKGGRYDCSDLDMVVGGREELSVEDNYGEHQTSKHRFRSVIRFGLCQREYFPSQALSSPIVKDIRVSDLR